MTDLNPIIDQNHSDSQSRRKLATKIVKDCERMMRLFSYSRVDACASFNGEHIPGGSVDHSAPKIRVGRGAYTVAIDGYELDFHLTPNGPRFYAEFPSAQAVQS